MSRPDADLVIVGGGLAAQRCCERLRREGFDGRIVVVCEESTPPYDRPALSKSVLTEERPVETLRFKPAHWYDEQGIELLLGVEAQTLEASSRTIVLRHAGDGERPPTPAGRLRYRRLLVATGSRPRRLPGLAPAERVHELRTREDAVALREALSARGGRLLVVGAGLVGMEVASSARLLGLDVTLLEAAPTPLARALPPALGEWIAGMHRRKGVDVRLATTVQDAELLFDGVRARLSDGGTVAAETVLVAAGTAPATAWLTGGEGPGAPIETDSLGRTALPDVYAAGDAACFPDPFLGEHLPTPHWEAAVRQGTVVAHAILGTPPPAHAPAMFWSDQHGTRIQMVGHAPHGGEIEFEGSPDLDAPLAAWITCGGRPAAAMLVDRPDLMARARRWIAAAAPPSTADTRTRKEQRDGLHTGDRRVRVPRAWGLRRAGA